MAKLCSDWIDCHNSQGSNLQGKIRICALQNLNWQGNKLITVRAVYVVVLSCVFAEPDEVI
ncbi:hypothetical protein FRX31_025180 [Thalictrum thalictroides]|uniref:Uncharacterized protein n=1 Tax=Thalictrum thalictroides TaxID=46969 RepID=A0A7J6VJD9_THATH|nr:hypothetical protein FRX31_025180 [Thalictrum thalictroides]